MVELPMTDVTIVIRPALELANWSEWQTLVPKNSFGRSRQVSGQLLGLNVDVQVEIATGDPGKERVVIAATEPNQQVGAGLVTAERVSARVKGGTVRIKMTA
jgi:hypothetical protein